MRAVALIALIATFSGPLLREAEGAEDLARSLAELSRGLLVEEVDGGIGDDSGATILTAKLIVMNRLAFTGFSCQSITGAWESSGSVHVLAPCCSPLNFLTYPSGLASTPLRLAWLHRFLF
jgi:hypothetical protein